MNFTVSYLYLDARGSFRKARIEVIEASVEEALRVAQRYSSHAAIAGTFQIEDRQRAAYPLGPIPEYAYGS